MTIKNTFGLLLVILTIALTSCQEDNFDEVVAEDPDYQVDTIVVNPYVLGLRSLNSDTLNIDCVLIPYPIELLQASGATITINDEAELDAALMQNDSIVDFVYPFTAIDRNGVVQINNITDFVASLVTCTIQEPTSCEDLDAHVLLFYNGLNIFTFNKYEYEIIYPAQLLVQGTTITLDEDADYIPAIGGNPSRPLETELVYPVTVMQFGQTIILNSDADVCEFYDTLLEPCEDKPAHIQFFYNEGGGVPISCAYFINFPVEIMLNGASIMLDDGEDYRNELNASTTAYDDISLTFPLRITRFTDGQDVVFDTESEVCDYLNTCQ